MHAGHSALVLVLAPFLLSPWPGCEGTGQDGAGFIVVWPGSDFKTVIEAAPDKHWIHFLPGIYDVPAYGCNISITRNVYMIAVKGTGERGSVPDNPVVLDCASQGRNFVVGPGIQLLVEGIHLRNGRADGAGGCINVGEATNMTIRQSELRGCYSLDNGGAISISPRAWIRIEHSSIRYNTVAGNGGGISIRQAHLSMETVLVEANTAAKYGGGLYSDESTMDMVHAIVSQNAVIGQKSEGGGVYLQESSLLADNSTISQNEAALYGGGLVARTRSTVVLNGCEVSDNFVQEDGLGGGIFIKDDVALNLLNRTSVARNLALHDGGGLYADSLCKIEIRDSGVYENMAQDDGGGFYVKQSSEVLLVRSEIMKNRAHYYGGGGALLSSTMDISESTISGNVVTFPGGRGAGLYGDNNADYRISVTDFVENEAIGGSGAGILIETKSQIDARDCTFLRNKALGGHGGAVAVGLGCEVTMSHCVFESNEARTEGCGNEAWDHCGGGGAVSLKGNARFQVLGQSYFIRNVGQGDIVKASGGAILAWDSAEIILKGTTLIHNSAKRGGAISALQDSRVECTGVSFINNTALGHGGALFVGSATFRSTEAPVIFRDGTHFEGNRCGNVVVSADGGAIFTNRPIEFMAGGLSVLRRNFASGRGGAVTSAQSDLVIGFRHEVEASGNEAGLDGGAIALLSGASLVLSHEECSTSCDKIKKADGTCNPECMSRACNWDGGDCLPVLNVAGQDAQEQCDRSECSLTAQTHGGSEGFGCKSSCFYASCDWSQHLCKTTREAIRECPLLDSSAFSSILHSQDKNDGGPMFLKGGMSDDFGRCKNGKTCMQPSDPVPMSVLLSRPGKLGPSALHLTGRSGGWMYAAMGKNRMQGSEGFTIEAWINPEISSGWQPGVMSGTPYGSLGYVLAGTNFALALRMVGVGKFTPVVFMVGPTPNTSCSLATVLTASTGTFSDGPSATARAEEEGLASCSWIIAPTGASSVTLVFTEFKFYQSPDITQYIKIEECSDVICSTIQYSSPELVGGRLPPPFTSSTGVMKVTLKNFYGGRPSGRGFRATYAISSGIQISARTWAHLAVSISASGFGRMQVDQVEVWSAQLDWNPELSPPFDGDYGTAIGRRSADWQDTYYDAGVLASSISVHEQDDEGFFYGYIDELRVWKSTRTSQQITEGEVWSCSYWQNDEHLVSCFSFDQTVSGNRFFPDEASDDAASYARPASGNTPHLPFCVNMDDNGILYKDDSSGDQEVGTENWGFCSEDKPRLPGAGFDYQLTDMYLATERRELGTAAVLKYYQGCGEVSLNFTNNFANRNGGAVFYDSCQGLNDGRFCFLELSSEQAILFHHNSARSAGGSIYLACSSIGLPCDLSFGIYNKIGALPSLSKAEFRGGSAIFYGRDVATKASRMSWVTNIPDARVFCAMTMKPSCSLCTNSSESGVQQGTITDGPGNYPNSQYCRWVIAADTAITLDFRAFELESGYDFVMVSACESIDCINRNEMGKLSGTSLSRTEFTSTAGVLEIIFSSDGDTSEAGFSADWWLSTDRSWHTRSFRPITPGKDAILFSVKMYDDLQNLVRGSDDLIEVRICSVTGPCDGMNTLIPSSYHSFDKQTGIAKVADPFECPVGSDVAAFEVSLVGSVGVPTLRGNIVCSPCSVGHSRTHTYFNSGTAASLGVEGTWMCRECSYSEYVVDPNNDMHRCYPCPSGDLCTSRDVFQRNVSVDSTEPAPNYVEIRSGEIWRQEKGMYMLESCSPGYVLINTTTETQQCKECETGFFSVEPALGCGKVRCDARPCIECSVGAICNKGSAHSWTHFVPKSLELGRRVLPWVDIIVLNETRRYHCASDYLSGTPGCIPEADAIARIPDQIIKKLQAEQESAAAGPCVDDMTFRDSQGLDCSTFNANPSWCEGSPEDGIHDPPSDYANDEGIDATMACCVCKPFASKSTSLMPAGDVRDLHLWEYDHEVPGYVLKKCPRGHQLINVSDTGDFSQTVQRCRPCGGTNYIIDRHMPCQKCPRGADCPDGARFVPKAKGSEWEETRAEDGGLQKRVLACPPGYELHRVDEVPELDDCKRCENGFYLLETSFWTGPNSTLPTCRPCYSGRASCSGADNVEALAGFWRLQFGYVDDHEYFTDTFCGSRWAAGESCLFPEGYFMIGGGWGLPLKCINLSVGLVCARPSEVVWKGTRRILRSSNSDLYDPYAPKIFKCPPGACSERNQCLQNRSGPVCGTCAPGYAMTTQGCSPQSCPTDEQISPLRIALIVVGSVVGALIYLLAAWRSVFPEIDYLLARILRAMTGLLSHVVCFGHFSPGPAATEEASEEDDEETAGLMSAVSGGAGLVLAKFELLKQKWEQIHGRQYMKIFLSYLQVLGSFTMFNVKWPPALNAVAQYMQGSAMFDILRMPGLACVWAKISFTMTMYFYTLAPLFIIAALGLPVVGAFARGLKTQEEVDHLNRRWSETLDKFWTSMMLMLFMLYPSVSMATMSAFNCDKNLGLLKIDYRELCPSTASFTFWWSVAFFILYPVGIPIFMHRACVFEGIHQIVREKLDGAHFQSMLSMFLHRGVSIESSRFARIVGSAVSEKVFVARADEEYDKMLALQGDGDVLSLDSLENLVKKLDESKEESQIENERWEETAQVLEGTSMREVVNFMRMYDDDGDGYVDREEFQDMIRISQEVAHLFTGSERLERLTDRQMEVLLLFDDWPKAHGHPIANGGLGHFVSVVQTEQFLDQNHDIAIESKYYDLALKGKRDKMTDNLITKPAGSVMLSLQRNAETGQAPTSITLTIFQAKDLPPMDMNGISDPYFTFHVGDKKPGKQAKSYILMTKVLKHTLNPKYDETFEIPISKQAKYLHVQCFDKDFGLNSDDLMGEVDIPLSSIDIVEVEAEREARLREIEDGARTHPLLEELDKIAHEIHEAIQEEKEQKEEERIKKVREEARSNRESKGKNKAVSNAAHRATQKAAETIRLAKAEENRAKQRSKLPPYVVEGQWRDDFHKAEKMYVDHPDHLELHLKKMRIKMLSTTGKQKKLSQLANRLVLDQIIAIPLQAWAPKRQDYNASPILSKEDIINYRLGFIFQAYRVQFWWWESMEMTRKFLMTSLLIFIYPEEPAQLAAGSMITFFFLFINLHFKPYCTDGLNSFQTYALVTQFLTLFVGIMIALQHDRQEVADDESNRVVREITNNVVVLMNAIVVIWPILRQIRYASFDEWWDTLQNWYETCTSPSRKREKSSALVHLATIRAPTSKEDKTTEKNLKVTVEADVIVVNGDHFQSSHGVLEDGVVRERPRRVSSFVTSEPDSLPVPHQAEPTAHSSEKIQESALAADGPAPPHRAKDKPRPDPVRDAPRLVSAHGPGMPMRGLRGVASPPGAPPLNYHDVQHFIEMDSGRPQARHIHLHNPKLESFATPKSVSFVEGVTPRGQNHQHRDSEAYVRDSPEFFSSGLSTQSSSTQSRHSMGAWLSSEKVQSSDKVPLDSTTPVESLPPSPRTAALDRLEQLETEIKNANRATREGIPIPYSREAQGRQGRSNLFFDGGDLGFA